MHLADVFINKTLRTPLPWAWGKLFFCVKVTVIGKGVSWLAFLESQGKRTALITSCWRHAEGGARPLSDG